MFNDVFFVNSKIGWIVGEDVDVLFTRNGGKTWKRHQFVSEFPLNGVWFANKYLGWTVGEYDRILTTGDGGKGWREQSNRFEGGETE